MTYLHISTTNSQKMKVLKYSLLGLLLLILIAVGVVLFYLEPLVKTTVNTVGTKIVGTQVNLDGFRFSPFAGEAEVKGLSVHYSLDNLSKAVDDSFNNKIFKAYIEV